MTDSDMLFTEERDERTGAVTLTPKDDDFDSVVDVQTTRQRRWPIEVQHTIFNPAEARVLIAMLTRACEIAEETSRG